jgi:SnoaL-like domain
MVIDSAGRQEIEDALLSYCRGIDRLDPEAVRAAFHPGAMLHGYAPEPTSIEAFVDRALVSLGTKFTATQHRISNTRVEQTADGARSESYVLASHVQTTDEGQRLHTFAGRYVDRFTHRDGRWRIEQRTLRHDWSTITPVTETMTGAWVQSGRQGSPDPLDD